MTRFRSVITSSPTPTLTPWDEAQLLFGLARKRIDEGQMRAAIGRASRQARIIAEAKLVEYGYAAALEPPVPGREEDVS
jgi:hypothetical protein